MASSDKDPATEQKAAGQSRSAWSPFSHRAFAVLWTATLVSNVGTWMHEVGAGWLMTTLNPSPAVVSLVQVANTLPVFVFALFAGALADRYDRRVMLIIVNVLMMLITFVLAGMVMTGQVTPARLLAITLLLGTGMAFVVPVWQAIVPMLVPRDELRPAIALHSMGINISRAVGPALAGGLIVIAGLAAPFVANAITHVGIILALLWWRPAPREQAPAAESLIASIGTGVTHSLRNPGLRATLVRTVAFLMFTMSFWALMPLVARGVPGGGPTLYGLMLGAVGVGAICGALLLARLADRLDANGLVATGTVLAAIGMVLMALARVELMAVGASLVAGMGWIFAISNLHVSAQLSLEDWVRARGLSVYLMVMAGSMAASAALWGQVATFTSVPTALLLSAAGALLAIVLSWPARLRASAP